MLVATIRSLEGTPERQGLGGADDVNIQFFRVAGRQSTLPGLGPKVGGEGAW